MKILFLTTHLNTGGITSYVLTLARGLKKKGHDVYVASSAGDCLYKFEESGINFFRIPIKTKAEINPKIFISYLKLLGFIKREGIQIVHSNTRVTQVLGCLLSNSCGVAHVSTCHGFFKRRLTRMMFPCWPDTVVAISQQVREHLINDLGVDESKITVIHNGIDVDSFSAPAKGQEKQRKQELGLKQGPVVGIVARLSDVKGHIYLIQAMKNVLNKFSDASLLIVGEGKMQGKLIILSRQLGIEKNIIFIASASDTRVVLAAMDVFVMPSVHEGLGLALMEAMAFGLPVIGSNVGGIKSLIQDGYNGILVEPRDVNALSSAIERMLSDMKAAQVMGNNAREFIKNNFDQEEMILNTERGYFKCLKKG